MVRVACVLTPARPGWAGSTSNLLGLSLEIEMWCECGGCFCTYLSLWEEPSGRNHYTRTIHMVHTALIHYLRTQASNLSDPPPPWKPNYGRDCRVFSRPPPTRRRRFLWRVSRWRSFASEFPSLSGSRAGSYHTALASERSGKCPCEPHKQCLRPIKLRAC